MKIKEILLELNVANVKEVDAFVSQYNFSSPFIKSWFKKQVRNYVLNNEEFAEPHVPRQHDEEWMHKAHERGEQIVIIHVDRQFENQLNHIIDWLYWLTEQDSIEATRILQKLPRLTVPMAIQKSEQWTEWLNKKASSSEDEEGLEIIMKFKDGFSWVLLKSKQCYDREGKLMQHCVGSYYDKQNTNKIYSLRDPQNQPHITMEVDPDPHSNWTEYDDEYGVDFVDYDDEEEKEDDWDEVVSRKWEAFSDTNPDNLPRIIQISGKQNEPPIEKYLPYIIKFIKEKNLLMDFKKLI